MKTLKKQLIAAFFVATALVCSSGALAQKKTLNIISYNILEGMKTDTTTGKQVFVDWVKQQNPDFMALQETNDFTQVKLEALAHSYDHPYAVITRERGYPPSISSKTPIVNVDKVLDNMWHGFIKCKINGYNIIVLHFSPSNPQKKREEIAVVLETIRQSGPFKKWMIMGDFNSVSPLDAQKYESQAQENPNRKPRDYFVHQNILDFGFVDAARQDKNFSMEDFRSRIDFIYVSPDLKDKIAECGFITDEFTKKNSDHRPIKLVLETE